MKEQDKLKCGVVGCGWAANAYHIPALRALEGVEIVAVCDQKEGVVAKTAQRWGISKAYRDFSCMLGEEKLDFVDICTPPPTHFQLSIQAMKVGLHVLVEKPMALSVSEADEMLTVSRKNNVKLCVAHNFLFSSAVQKAKALVDAGTIGDLISVDIELVNRREMISKQSHWYHSLPAGVFSDYAPHAVYLGSAFLGNIRSVKAIARKYSDFPWVAADELKVLLEAENGLGSLTISCNSPRASFAMDILGTKRSLHLDILTMSLIHHKSGVNRLRDLILDELSSSLQQTIGAVSISLGAVFGQKISYRIGEHAIIQGFIESIRDDIVPPVTGEDGRETLRILDDIWSQISSPSSPTGRNRS